MTRSDSDIQRDVIAELRWEPSLRDDDVALAVRDGVVTLTGLVDSCADRSKAESAATRVKGVKAVVNDLEVTLPSSSERPDPEIARAILDALRWDISVPDDRIRARVEKGWVTLEGDVDWYYQRDETERVAGRTTGVRGVTDRIVVREQPTTGDVKQRIREALQRGAALDADRITVEVDGHRALLRGTVRSYAEMRDAERAARNAPGVTEVENALAIDPGVYAGA
ncbi:MAG: BON domain-containing protein [Gemmatimonadaceae bacterium]